MDKDMELFLRKRNVQDEIIDKMNKDKIDRFVVQADESILEQYLEVGDRVALKHFCKEKPVNMPNKKRKESMLCKLRRKLICQEDTPKVKNREKRSQQKKNKLSHLIGNSNARKTTRVVLIGWINLRHSDNLFHQVSGKNGGVPRKQTVSKIATKKDILDLAKGKFFRNGISKLGKLEDFETDLLDFTEQPLDEKETVFEMLERTGISMLRFNLATKSIQSSDCTKAKATCETNQSTETVQMPAENKSECLTIPDEFIATDDHPKRNDLRNNEKLESPSCDLSSITRSRRSDCLALLNPSVPPHILCESSSDDEVVICNTSQSSALNYDDTNDTLSYTPRRKGHCEEKASEDIITRAAIAAGIDMTPFVIGEASCTDTDSSGIVNNQSVAVHELDEPRSPTPPPSIGDPVRVLRIHRVSIEEELIANFVDPMIMYDTINFQFVDERGVDADGVSREAYAGFWAEFMEKSTTGEAERVPCVKPSMQRPEWEAVGRILAKGFIDHGIFPMNLCKVFTIAVIHGERSVTNESMLESFLNYIAPMEKDVVEKAINKQIEEEDDKEVFIDMLCRMGCTSVPTDGVRALLLNIANKELIQRPKYAVDAIASTARKDLILKLPTIQSVCLMYESKRPTNLKVIRLLQPQETGIDQEKCMGYLKQYIKGLDILTLKRFLHHVTGSDMIAVDKIEVHFNKRTGINRVPVVRTCTPLIELSATYSSHTELRAEFTALLRVHHPLDID